MLKKGDIVVMHTCGEAKEHDGELWTCKGDEFISSSGYPVVFLEGYSGYFSVKYLQKVKIEALDLRDESIRFISFHSTDGKGVHQIVFSETTIILNDEQIERLRY